MHECHPLDTLRLSRTLRERGHFSPEQAETLAEALGEAQHGELATKADIAALDARIGNLETRMGHLATKAELAEMKSDILKWTAGAPVTLVRIFVK